MSAEAASLRCPSCGAPAQPTDTSCRYCSASLHAVRCPWCFQWTFSETRDCPRCGATAPAERAGDEPKTCPSCRAPGLAARALGGARLWGCGGCGGVWADSASFKKVCEDRAVQAVYLGKGSPLPASGAVADPTRDRVVYRPCPVCGELMNRFNFSGTSGVILDACRPHGVWFDADELRRIVAFIAAGGLDAAREREKAELEEARRRLENSQKQSAQASLFDSELARHRDPAHILSAASLLDIFFGRG